MSERDLDFDEWYTAVRPRLVAALSGWCRDPSIAADAADEAFVRAIERWPRVSQSPSPEGWVWRTATNVVRRRIRRRATEHRILRRTTRGTSTAEDPTPLRDTELLRALQQLTERQRTIVVLHYIADRSVKEIATMIDAAPGTVTATLHQARTKLATQLTDRLDPEPQPTTRIDGALP